jgi:diaminopimelate decarboxylase
MNINKLLFEISNTRDTPFYVYFEKKIKENYKEILHAFSSKYSNSHIAYSVKNCCIPGVIKILEKFSPLYEVTSLGEMMLLKKMGINLKNCIFTNIYKSEDAIKFAITNNLGYYAIDSYSDMEHIEKIIKEENKTINALIRVNPAINIRDTIFASATPWSKTGMEIGTNKTDYAEDLLKSAQDIDQLNIVGLHGHLGSQVININYYKDFTKSIVKFYYDMEKKYQLNMNIIDFGGGYPVQYELEKIPNITEISDTILNILVDQGISPKFIIESGRFITANAGILVSKVVGLKNNPFIGKIVIIDISMYSHLLDSILVNWYFNINKLNNNKGKMEDVTIVGMTNDTLDHLDPEILNKTKKRKLSSVKENDVFLIENTGAYTTCFNNNYCLLPKPEVLLITENNKIKVIRKREKYKDIFCQYEF